MKKIELLTLITVVSILGGCASAPKPLDTAKLESNKISQIHLVAENEIQINLSASTAGAQFGLLGALVDAAVDSHRKKKAEQTVADIKGNMSDFDFRSIINEKIPQKLQSKAFIENLNISIIEGEEIPEDDFIVGGDYQLSDNFSHVNVNLTTALYEIEEKPITRLYSIISKIEGSTFKREDNATLIAENNSDQLKSIVTQSVDEALTIMNKDFAGEYLYQEDAKKVSFSDGTYPYTGRLLEENNNKVIAGFTQFGITGIFSVPSETAMIKSN